MAEIKEINGNIFNTSCEYIVNTVNCLGVMGKGIAYEFKLRHPDMFEQYKKHCQEGSIRPGVLYPWTKTTPKILNFPTKYDWKEPSKIEYLQLGLKKFSNFYNKMEISSIAFPLLGTDAGGLDIKDVLELMKKHLNPLNNLHVEIYHFDKNAKDNLFDKLMIKVDRFDLVDYMHYLKLNKSQADLLKTKLESGRYSQMIEIQFIKGIGDKTLEKIHQFLKSNEKIITNRDNNPTLF